MNIRGLCLALFLLAFTMDAQALPNPFGHGLPLAAQGDLACELTEVGDGLPDAWGANLRLLYFGIEDAAYQVSQTPAAEVTANCGGAQRLALAQSCGLYHLYRSSEAARASSDLRQQLSVPANQPFCNAPDMDASGLSDAVDGDPIRIPCSHGEDACGCDGTLGLVLPIVVPSVAASYGTDVLYPLLRCEGGYQITFGEKNSNGAAIVSSPSVSPWCSEGSQKVVGGCVFPTTSAASGSAANCMFHNVDRSGGTLQALLRGGAYGNPMCPEGDGPNDARAMNLDVRSSTGTVLAGATPNDPSISDWHGRGFFRIHSFSGVTSTPSAPECQELDATHQIHCLVARDAEADLASVGIVGTEGECLGAPGGTPCGVSAVCDGAGSCEPILPPDPNEVAPDVPLTTSLSQADRASFLYTGVDPVQTGVAPNTIKPERAAIVRGRVLDAAGDPLPLVQVDVLGHPELGGTRTREDGAFDLVVNAGGRLTLGFGLPGYINGARGIVARWNDSIVVEDVRLAEIDPAVTGIDLEEPGTQVVTGSAVADEDGARQPFLFFKEGTTATMELPDGSTAPLDVLNVHITEFTVGPAGPSAMPADLPATSAYTFAIEFTSEEAVALGAKNTRFSQPASLYLENFLGFPVGTRVPAGSYERFRGEWVAEPNGRVIRIVSENGGLADIAISSSGAAASASELAAIGIDAAERAQLASTYAPGAELWRVPVSHFTMPLDLNWPYTPNDPTPPPPPPPPPDNMPEDNQPIQCGSIIEVADQILGQRMPIVGTPIALYYSSDRVPGRRDQFQVEIPVSSATTGPTTLGYKVEVSVAGQATTQTFEASPNLEYVFEWDGRDAYGRVLQGRHPASISVGRVVPAAYTAPSGLSQAFGQFSDVPGTAITSDRTREEITLWQRYTRAVGVADVRETSVAGWTIDLQHWYDPIGQTLYLGNGKRRSVEQLGHVLEPYAGLPNGLGVDSADGLPAANAEFTAIQSIAVGPDGALYVAATDVYRVDPATSIVTKIIGSPASCASTPMPPDGGPALTSCIGTNKSIAMAPNGRLYVADRIGPQSIPRIRRLDPDGTIHLVAGGVAAAGTCAFQNNNGPIANARLCPVIDIAVGQDGAIYTMEQGDSATKAHVRKISTDGWVNTLVPLVEATVGNGGIDVGRDGSVYVTDPGRHAVNRLHPERTYLVVAGNFSDLGPGYEGDGGPGNVSYLIGPDEVTVAPDGTLYISDRGNSAIRIVDTKAIINTFAGGPSLSGVYSGDHGAPGGAGIGMRTRTALAPDGTLYIAQDDRRIRRVRPGVPGGALSANFFIAAESGDEVYEFDKNGRHLRTLHALTGGTLWTFGYNAEGRLVTVTDGDDNVTTVVREATGRPIEIVGPYGQTTQLQTDANGFLSQLVDPANATTAFTYSSSGLMQTMTDANAGLHEFTFDSEGFLVRDENPAGGYTELDRTETATSVTVDGTTAESVTSQYSQQLLSTGVEETSYRQGIATPTVTAFDVNKQTLTTTRVDGTVITTASKPDPRWGIKQPLPASVTRTPSNNSITTTSESTASLSTSTNPFSLQNLTRTQRTNGFGATSTYDPSTRTWTRQSVAGRTTTTVIDLQGRTTRIEVPNILPTELTYDSRGRLEVTQQGTRTTEYTYDLFGRLATTEDALSRVEQFEYDDAGRLVEHTFPDLAIEQFGYDPLGLRTSVTPPGRPAHLFAYTPDNHVMTYTPPNTGIGPTATGYSYNLDGKATTTTRPDALTITTAYDTAGRRQSVTIPGGLLTYGYHATQGNLTTLTGPYTTNLAYTYDGHLPLSTTWSGGVVGAVTWTYDNSFRKVTEAVAGASGSALTKFGYDADDLLTCASPTNCAPPAADALTITRHPQNALLTARNLGNVTESLTYNDYGELAAQVVSYNGSEVYSVTYDTASQHRDALGRVVQKLERVQGVQRVEDYQYDDRGRLTDVLVDTTTTEHWEYDTNSNRLATSGPCPAEESDYDDQDRLTGCGNTTFTYTDNGELSSKTQTGIGTTQYQYDVLGNLLSVTLPNGTLIEYLIDGENRRVGKKVNGTVVQRWLYRDGLKPVAELNGAGALVSQFVYGSNPNVPDYVVRGGAKYRVVTDQLGSVRLVINVATGAVAQTMRHDAWGNVVAQTGSGFVPFGFAGGLYDVDTGLVRFGARDYDPVFGRWTAKDPIGFEAGPNQYTYVDADGINSVDIDGRDPESIECKRCLGDAARDEDRCIARCVVDHVPICSAPSDLGYMECYEQCGLKSVDRVIACNAGPCAR